MVMYRWRSAGARAMRCVTWALGAWPLLVLAPALVHAQDANRLSLATGGPGGIYQPLGSGMADLLERHLPGLDVAAEPTQGSHENLKLLGAGKADLGFCRVDSAWQGVYGAERLRNVRGEPRTLLMLYPNRMQVVTAERTGIDSFADLKGKRVSTGAEGGGVEVMAMRELEAAGVDPKLDIEQMHLGLADSIAALTEGRIPARPARAKGSSAERRPRDRRFLALPARSRQDRWDRSVRSLDLLLGSLQCVGRQASSSCSSSQSSYSSRFSSMKSTMTS
jgi:hypothetical protein